MLLIDNHASTVAACLDLNTTSFEKQEHGVWKFELDVDEAATGTARIDADWLSLSVPVQNRRSTGRLGRRILARSLETNANLPGRAKCTLFAEPPQLALSAEVLLDEDVNIGERIEQALLGITEGFTAIDGDQRELSIEPGANGDGANRESAVSESDVDNDQEKRQAWIQQLCEEFDWTAKPRAEGRTAVDLDVPGGFHQAIVEPLESSGMRVSVALGEPAEDEPVVCRQARDVLLLTAGRIVRFARAASGGADSIPGRWWEVVFVDEPAGRELDAALSALSMACRLTAREFQAMGDESLAGAYLAVRGWSS